MPSVLVLYSHISVKTLVIGLCIYSKISSRLVFFSFSWNGNNTGESIPSHTALVRFETKQMESKFSTQS